MKHTSHSAGFSTIALIVALGAAAIIGFGLFFATRFSTPSNPSNARMEGNPTSTENLTDRELHTTIPDIVGRGQSLECDWKLPASAGPNPFNKGKLWTTANKGRSSIIADINGMSMESNALYQSNVVYSWTTVAGQKIGMKFSEETLAAQNNAMTAEQRQQAEQIRSNMIMSCKPWIVDETKFTLPSDVEFKEL